MKEKLHNEETVLIVVEGGVVNHIETTLPALNIIILDLDNIRASGHDPSTGHALYTPDETARAHEDMQDALNAFHEGSNAVIDWLEGDSRGGDTPKTQ